MRVLLISDWAHTGFGRVGRELGHGLLARGYDVRVIAINWRGVDGELASIISRDPTGDFRDSARALFDEMMADPLLDRMIPAGITVNGRSHGLGHGLTAPAVTGLVWRGWKPEAVIVVADPLAMLNRLLEDGGALGTLPTYNYVPIEGTGLPRAYQIIWRYTHPVAMSTFGQTELQALLGRSVPLVPHGAADSFYPITAATPGHYKGRSVTSKNAAKEVFDLGDRTVVLRIDRHIHRKNYAAFFRLMRPVLAAHPEVVCVLHCRPIDEYGSLYELLSREPGAINATPDTTIGWDHPQYILTNAHDTWRGLSDADLNVLYNAADLLVSPTMAEGFGLTLAEALACEVPVVSTNYSAVPEVVGPGGVLIDPAAFVTNEYAHEWALVDEPAMSRAVERLVSKPALRRELGRAGRRHIAHYTWTATVEGFDRLLRGEVATAA